MSARRPASLLAFAIGCLFLGGAALTLLSAWLLPAASLEDLGRVVGAMLLAALSLPFFAGALYLGRGGGLPRWMLAVSVAGVLLGLVPALALASTRL